MANIESSVSSTERIIGDSPISSTKLEADVVNAIFRSRRWVILFYEKFRLGVEALWPQREDLQPYMLSPLSIGFRLML